MIRLRGMGRRTVESVACSGSGSGFGVSAGVIVTQDKRSGWMLVSGPDGSVHMPPSRVVDAKGRRQEARDPCRGRTPSRNPRQLPKPRQSIRVHSWRPDRQICAGTGVHARPRRGLHNDSWAWSKRTVP